jgi:hypothetical protein
LRSILSTHLSDGFALNSAVASGAVPDDSRARPLPLEHAALPNLSARRAANWLTNIVFIPLSRPRPRLGAIGTAAPGVTEVSVWASRQQKFRSVISHVLRSGAVVVLVWRINGVERRPAWHVAFSSADPAHVIEL